MNIEELEERENALMLFRELQALKIVECLLTEEGRNRKNELEEFVFNNAELIFD